MLWSFKTTTNLNSVANGESRFLEFGFNVCHLCLVSFSISARISIRKNSNLDRYDA